MGKDTYYQYQGLVWPSPPCPQYAVMASHGADVVLGFIIWREFCYVNIGWMLWINIIINLLVL
jgi:hypothetical protein